MQGDVEILGRYGVEVLREAFARVRVEVAADHATDVGELIRGEARAAAEHHVFLRVRRSRKDRGRLIGANEVVHRRRGYRGERVTHDYHLQAVREGRAKDAGGGD